MSLSLHLYKQLVFLANACYRAYTIWCIFLCLFVTFNWIMSRISLATISTFILSDTYSANIIISNHLKLILFLLIPLLWILLILSPTSWIFCRSSWTDVLGVSCVLNTCYQRELSRIIIFISLQIVLIHGFFNTRHISIHLELLSHFKLLIKHIFISLLHLLFIVLQMIFHLPILLGLYFRLLLIESWWIIQSFQIISFLKLHLKLLII